MEDLPREIRSCIMSFLPLKEAVRTALLSTAWRAFWEPCILEMEFDSDRIMQVIGKFLKSCETHDLLRISCRIPDGEIRQISAAKGVERELYLGFHNEKPDMQNFSLRLDSRNFSKLPSDVSGSRFAYLKSLHLKSVTHAFGKVSSVLFSNCMSLERLKLEQCRGLRSLNIVLGDRLEDLTVIDCPNMAEIEVSAMRLESFTYRGPLPRIKMKDSPSLVDVTLDMNVVGLGGLDQNEFDCEDLLSLFASLRNVEALNITGWLLEWLCSAGVIFQRLDLRFNRLTQLQVAEPVMNSTKLDSLACFLDICPSLEKLCIDIDRERGDSIRPYFYEYWHEPYLGSEHSILKANIPARLERLRAVEVNGFQINDCGLRLLDLLLKRALLLSSMAVRFRGGLRRGVVKLPLTQLRRSEDYYLSPNKDYYLGFTKAGSVKKKWA